MPSGKLGNADLTGGQNKTLYTTPASTVTTATISLTNRGTSIAYARVAIAQADVPVAAEYIEYDAPIPVGGTLERTGVAMSAGERIVVRTDVSSVSSRAHGFEEAA